MDEAHRLTRDVWTKAQRLARVDSNAELDDALSSLDGSNPTAGKTDHDILNALIKQRYATGIKQSTKDGEYEEFTRSGVSQAIDTYAEHILTRLYRRIVTATATLFTQPDMRFQWLDESGDVKPETLDLINWHRERGMAVQHLIRCDRLATGLGSSLLRLVWSQGHLQYHAHPPQCVYVGYTPQIWDNDEQRSPDYMDIEDAAVLAIYLGTDTGDESSTSYLHRWIAYFGRSEGYPNGRCCTYRAMNWYGIPEPGQSGVTYEYEHEGDYCNPLTWLQNKLGTEVAPYEYPVVRFLGNDAGLNSGQVMPTNGLALWQDCRELDVAWSRVLSAAIEGAKDTILIRNPSGATLPRNLSGAVHLKEQQEASLLGLNAANALSAANVLEKLQATVASAWNVPPHMVVADASAQAPSGYSIALKSQPLIDYRRERVELNRSSVAKLWDIERSLIAVHDDPGRIPVTVYQQWDPGEWRPPTNKTEQLGDLKAAKELKLIDHIGMVREYYDLESDEDAKDLIDQMTERAADYPTDNGGNGAARRPIPPLTPRPPRGGVEPV